MYHLQVLSSHRSQRLSFRPRSIWIRLGCFIKIKCIIRCKSGHDEVNLEMLFGQQHNHVHADLKVSSNIIIIFLFHLYTTTDQCIRTFQKKKYKTCMKKHCSKHIYFSYHWLTLNKLIIIFGIKLFKWFSFGSLQKWTMQGGSRVCKRETTGLLYRLKRKEQWLVLN